jgi:N-acetylneuraminic acid mutarotase
MTKLVTAAIVLIAAAPLPGTWTNGPALPVARSEVAVASLGDRMYVIGGYANGKVDQSLVQMLRPLEEDGGVVRGAWQDVAPLPRGLNHIGAVGYGGRVYAFGGFSAQNNAAVSDANVYDPATNKWGAIAPLPRALGSVSVAVLGKEIHLVGGRDVHSVPTHLVYDPATNHYSVRASLPVGRDHMGLVSLHGRLYAVGGRIDTPAHNTAYVDAYDSTADSWKSAAPLPAPRSGMAVAEYQGKIFAIGGEEAGMRQSFSTNFGYDPRKNVWSDYAPLPEGRHGTGAAVVAGRLFVPAGAAVPGGSRQNNSLYVFVLVVPAAVTLTSNAIDR